MTRTPPQSAAMSRVPWASSVDPMPVETSESPTRLAMATPFHRPSPWWAVSYPRAAKAPWGNTASACLVSCMQRTSGWA